MNDIVEIFSSALGLVAALDGSLVEIVGLSLFVSLSAVAIAAVIGLPAGALVAVVRFPGRGALIVFINALMGLPPVVVGLVIYLMLSASGPLGPLRLLYTPTAMIIAQVVLVTPIVLALTRQTLQDLLRDYDDQFNLLGLSTLTKSVTLLWEARLSLITVVLAGFGRAIAEVGAVIIVGGNIQHVTRTMTTAIALETSKGDLALAFALGIILLMLALAVNAAIAIAQLERHQPLPA